MQAGRFFNSKVGENHWCMALYLESRFHILISTDLAHSSSLPSLDLSNFLFQILSLTYLSIYTSYLFSIYFCIIYPFDMPPIYLFLFLSISTYEH